MNARIFFERATGIIRRLPLVGRVFECGLGEHWKTLEELSSGLFWSMLPIWVGTYIAFLKGPLFNWTGLRGAFGGAIEGGELFIYAAAFLAPISWIVHRDPPGAGEFPSKLAHTILTAVLTVFSAISFALQRTGQAVNPTALHALSIIFFWLSLFLIYLATLYHNHRLPASLPEEMRSQEDRFLNEYRKRHQ